MGVIRRVLCAGLAAALVACAAPAPRETVHATGKAPAYEERLIHGRELLHERRYAAALDALAQAERMEPGRGEAQGLRLRAWFRTDRFAEVVAGCSELQADHPELTWVLPLCWGARLEVAGFTPEAEAGVRQEIESL